MTLEEQHAAIRKLHAEGYNDMQIARIIGFKHYRVVETRKKLGLVRKTRKWAYIEAIKYVGKTK